MKQAIPKTCRRLRDWLPPYAEGKLEGALAAAVARHLVTCVRCRREAADLRAMLNTLHSVPAEKMPDDLVASISRAVTQRPPQGALLRPSWQRLAIPTAVVTGALAILLTLNRAPRELSTQRSARAPAHLGTGAELSRAAKGKRARHPTAPAASADRRDIPPAGPAALDQWRGAGEGDAAYGFGEPSGPVKDSASTRKGERQQLARARHLGSGVMAGGAAGAPSPQAKPPGTLAVGEEGERGLSAPAAAALPSKSAESAAVLGEPDARDSFTAPSAAGAAAPRRTPAESSNGVRPKRATQPDRREPITAGGGGAADRMGEPGRAAGGAGAAGAAPPDGRVRRPGAGTIKPGHPEEPKPRKGLPESTRPPRWKREATRPATTVTMVTPRARLVKVGGKLTVVLRVDAPGPIEDLQVRVGEREVRQGAARAGVSVVVAQEDGDARPRRVPVTVTYGGMPHQYTLYLPAFSRVGQLRGDAARRQYRDKPLEYVLSDISWRRGLIILVEGALDRKVNADVILGSPRAAMQTVAKYGNYELHSDGYAYTLTPRPEQ